MGNANWFQREMKIGLIAALKSYQAEVTALRDVSHSDWFSDH